MSWQLATSPTSPCLQKNNDKSKDVRLDGLAVKHILLTLELVIVAFMPTNDNFIFNIEDDISDKQTLLFLSKVL